MPRHEKKWESAQRIKINDGEKKECVMRGEADVLFKFNFFDEKKVFFEKQNFKKFLGKTWKMEISWYFFLL